jgi:hypothetical protein
MKPAFIEVLYEQPAAIGTHAKDRAHSMHYSILRARVWHKPDGSLSEQAIDHTFSVIWDEDHDERVYLAIEKLHASGQLANVKFIGERKGGLDIVTISPILAERRPQRGFEDDGATAPFPGSMFVGTERAGDYWSVDITPDHCGYGDAAYLQSIELLWELGGKPVTFPAEPADEVKPSKGGR